MTGMYLQEMPGFEMFSLFFQAPFSWKFRCGSTRKNLGVSSNDNPPAHETFTMVLL